MQRDKQVRKSVEEGKYVVVSIDANAAYKQYFAGPLITCFAYLIFYQTKNNEQKAIFFHALSGHPTQLKDIFDTIKSDYQSVDKIIIAISGSISNSTITKLIDQAKIILEDTFLKYSSTKAKLEILENANCYIIDTLGNHGETIKPQTDKKEYENTKSDLQDIFVFLSNLKKDLHSTPFTIINWLNNEVPGKPKGIEALSKYVEHLDQAKNEMDMLLTIFKKVDIEFAKIQSRKSDDRTKTTRNFYELYNDRLSELKIKLNFVVDKKLGI